MYQYEFKIYRSDGLPGSSSSIRRKVGANNAKMLKKALDYVIRETLRMYYPNTNRQVKWVEQVGKHIEYRFTDGKSIDVYVTVTVIEPRELEVPNILNPQEED